MKMTIKRMLGLLAGVMVLTGLAGCQMAIDLMDTAASSVSGVGIGTAFYADLSSMINSPDRLYNSSSYDGYLDKNITFTAMVLSEPEMLEFDEEDGGPRRYISAAIARNERNYMLVDVDDLEDIPLPGEIVEIQGQIKGYIYYVEDNQNVNKLDVKAGKMTVKEPEDNPDTGNQITFNENYAKGIIEFKEAVQQKDSFDKNITVLYFEFTNNETTDQTSPIDKVTFYQGDTYLRAVSSQVQSGVDPQAMWHMVTNATKPGKTFLYYVVLRTEDNEQEMTSDPVTAYFYDDDYNCLNEIEILVK